MRMRTYLSALTLAVAAGLSTACGGDAGETAKGATSASAGAASGTASSAPASGAASGGASSSAGANTGAKADTERICKNVVAAFEAEKMQLVELILKLATEQDKAVQAKAKADAVALVQRLKAVVDKETATAADPKVTAALQKLVTTLGGMLTPEGVADPDFDKKMDAVVSEAATYCPALKDA